MPQGAYTGAGGSDIAWGQIQSDLAKSGKDSGFNMSSFAPKPGEDYDSWMKRLDEHAQSENLWSGTPFGGSANAHALLDYLRKNRSQYAGSFQTPQDAAAKAQVDKEAAFQQWRQSTMQRLDAFSKEMGLPVEELIKRGDLGVMNAGNNAISSAGSAAYGAGLDSGGVSSMNTQRAVTDAQSKYQLARQGLGLQATQGLLGEMGNMAHETEDTRRYEQGLNMSLQQANEQARQMRFAQGQQQTSQIFGAVGGAAGAYFGGPAGASAGYNLGSGLGGAAYGQYRPNNLTYPSGSRGGGLGGGRNPYGGSQ